MKQNYARQLLILFVILCAISCPAQTENVQKSPLMVTADWNCFRANEEMSFLEFSAAIGRSSLTYVEDGERFSAEFLIDAALVQADSVVQRKVWRNKNTVDDTSTVNAAQQLYVLNSFFAEQGEYQLRLSVTDANDTLKVTDVLMNMSSYDFTGSPSMSDVQIAASIARDNTENPFTKNGYKVMPNPSALYGIGLPILYIYTEFYNLTAATSDKGQDYIVTYQVFNADKQLVKEFPSKTRKKPGASAVDVNNLNVVTLVSGAYTLKVSLTDLETDQTVSRERRFFVFRESDYSPENLAAQQTKGQVQQGEGSGSAGTDADRYDIMTEEELDTEFEFARYISNRDDRRTWKKLNLEGKIAYIKEFWSLRDETPGTPQNEFKQGYLERVHLANTLYRGNFKEGWRTDRGRVLLVYGKPDEIERYPQSGDNKEYSRWLYYSLQGGVEFVFVDKHGLGDQELVHSTTRGELYDQDWTRWIDPNQ